MQILLLLLFIALFVIPYIFFLLTQQKVLNLIRIEHRKMNPNKVWYQLIPIVGMIWGFIVVRKVATSIYNDLNTPDDDSILGVSTPVRPNPTYSIGLAFNILLCCSVIPIPFINSMFSLAGLICWVIYWVKLSNYKKMLETRALILIPQ